MAFLISLIALEALLILFAAPLPVSVRLHVSDERSYAAVSVSLFGARLVTARAEIAKDRVRMRINGKNAEEVALEIVRTFDIPLRKRP